MEKGDLSTNRNIYGERGKGYRLGIRHLLSQRREVTVIKKRSDGSQDNRCSQKGIKESIRSGAGHEEEKKGIMWKQTGKHAEGDRVPPQCYTWTRVTSAPQ